MIDTLSFYIPRIFTIYLSLIFITCGAICYFQIYPFLKPNFPKESKVAKYGGLVYMIIGPLSFILVKLLF